MKPLTLLRSVPNLRLAPRDLNPDPNPEDEMASVTKSNAAVESVCTGEAYEICPEGWPRYDYRGIYLCRACERCEKAKLAGFRRVIVEGPYDQNDVIESIEEEE